MFETRIGNSVVRVDPFLVGARRAEGVCVLIDVFRAATTACAILSRSPKMYVLALDDADAARASAEYGDALLVGKPELDSDLAYDAPNSPSLVVEQPINGRVVVHKTAAGGRGAIVAERAQRVLLAGFANLSATARELNNAGLITLVPLGHEGIRAAPEDELCAIALMAALRGAQPDDPMRSKLRETSGRYFFEGNESEYPARDYTHCLGLDRYAGAIIVAARAHREGLGHAASTRPTVRWASQ